MLVQLLTLLLGISFAEPNVCDSLSGLACAPGKFKDGTGTVPSESEIKNLRLDEENKARGLFKDEFSKALIAPDSEYFREQAKQALALSDAPDCQSSEVSEKKQCDENLLEGLVNLAMNQSFSGGYDKVGDLRATNLLTRNKIFADIVEKARESADSRLQNNALVSRIENQTVPQVKNLIITKISSFPFTEEQKKLLTSKVKAIQFAGTDCSAFGNNIDAMFIPNAYYAPDENTFRYCAGLNLRSTSDFTLGFIVAHELAHSIDPCVASFGLERQGQMGKTLGATVEELDAQSPFKDLIACLRDKKSVGAENMTREAKNNSSPGTSKTPSPSKDLCDDQLGESFADWMAAEILPSLIKNSHNLTQAQYINGYANAYRPICQSQPNEGPDQHPQDAARIDKLILVNPRVRADMGCSPKHPTNTYCTIHGSETSTPPESASENGTRRVEN